MVDNVGVYRILDNIRNLVIRVTLRKVGISDNLSYLDEQSVDIRWGEKYFSQHEEEKYADDTNCLTSTEKSYHDQILNLREHGGRPNNRLFTYLRPKLETGLPLVVNGTPVVTKATEKMSVKSRKALSNRDVDWMHIMADLRRSDCVTGDEYILCQLMVNGEGVLSIKPDLADGVWNKVENMHNDVYEYRLENISVVMDSTSKRKQKQLKLKALQLTTSRVDPGSWSITSPLDNEFQMHIFGSIVSATEFPTDYLYIQLHIATANGWALDTSSDITSTIVTQTSLCQNGIAHFSCPVEYTLNLSDGDQWPHIVCEVCSLDSWDRHSVVGYGSVALPHTAGVHSLTVSTWRPKPRYLTERLRRFFIGGGPELKDSDYITNSTCSQSSSTRYGFQTESSGSVDLHLCTVLQRL